MTTATGRGAGYLAVPGGPAYRWTEPWNAWLDSRGPAEARAWIHSGIGVCRSGDVLVTSHGSAQAHLLSPDGGVVAVFDTGVTQAHSLLVVEDAGREVVWIADSGSRRMRDSNGDYPSVRGSVPTRAIKMTLDGERLLSVPAPDIEAYRSGRFRPTGVAVDEVSLGGTGDIFVTDGYGESLVHRFRADGTYVSTLNGEEGAGRFANPHAVWIDRRRGESELYVSDRKNHRLQVFGLDGSFRRVVGDSSVLRRPGGFAVDASYLIVSELEARLAVLDGDDAMMGYLGQDDAPAARPGFPNELDDHDHPRRPSALRAGYFNSPHGLAADAEGNLYITEFMIGGRLIKLVRE